MSKPVNSYQQMATKISMKYLILLSVIGITWLMSGCQIIASQSPENTLESISASDTGCIAPCWRSLQPRLSNEEAFLKLVEASSPRLFNDIDHTDLSPEGIEYTWDDLEYDIFTRVRIHEDRIKLFGFQPENDDINLSMIIASYGQPSSYGAFILGRHDYYIILTMVYEEKGIVVEADFSIDLDQQQVATTTCEFKIDWNATPRRLYIYLVESGSAKVMVRNDPIVGFGNPAHEPQSWQNENPVKLTSCLQ